MTCTNHITTPEQAAEAIAAQIRERFGAESTFDLIARGNEIVWEGGPFEWSTDLPYAVFSEAAPDLEALGGKPQYKGGWSYTVPGGFQVEAVNGYSVAVFRS